MIGLVLLLLLPTRTIWFLLDHKRNVSDGVVSGIGTLFSLDHKLCASDYYSDSDSDSVASENQPLIWTLLHCTKEAAIRTARSRLLVATFVIKNLITSS